MRNNAALYFVGFLMAFLGSSLAALAQQGNVWYFGDHAGLNFNTSPPTALTDGQIATYEGCTSISDKLGNILFYTDGSKLYNRLHQVMPNGGGLLGGSSSTNSAIVIPKPGSEYIYYVFTSEQITGALNITYAFSEVDMRLDNNNGDVIASRKNIFLYKPGTERLTAVSHANGKDYWVITKNFGDKFLVYKIDCNGVDMVPVVSTVGFTTVGLYDAIGAIKASPNGKKVAMATAGGVGELFDFDNTSGKLSNPITLGGYQPVGIYGIEFSPNSKLLYVSTGQRIINQYDITSNNAVAINASKYAILAPANQFIDAMQIGPDKKIYVAVNGLSFLNLISNPDIAGVDCNFTSFAVDLKGRLCRFGLPVYISSFFDANNRVDFTYAFTDCKLQFKGTTDLASTLNWYWDFGDGKTGTGQNVIHQYGQSGTYNVIIKGVPIGTCAITDTFYATHAVTVTVNAVSAYAGKDTTVLYGMPFNLKATATPAAVTYEWKPATNLNNPFIANPVAVATNDIIYTLKITDANGCTATDDIFIKIDGTDDLFMPSSFTPDANGLNDVFKPLGFGFKKIEYFKVFNRYGQLIFATSALGKGWNGTYKDKAQPGGAYTYMVKVVTYTGKTVERAGTVLLLR